MQGSILTVDASAMPKLMEVLRKYKQVTGRSWDNIAYYEGRGWSFELYRQFKKISPKPTQITGAAKARGYNVNRSSSMLGAKGAASSAAAEAGADALLGGEKSQYFSVINDANGVRLRRVRFSARGKNKRLIGDRNGNKFSKSSIGVRQLESETRAAKLAANPDVKLLNRRAVIVANELRLRSMAGKGGTMGVQWLPEVFKKRKSSTVKDSVLIVRSTKGIPMGRVDFRASNEKPMFQISAFVPGTARQITKNGIINKVQGARVADRLQYIQKVMEAAKQKALSGK